MSKIKSMIETYDSLTAEERKVFFTLLSILHPGEVPEQKGKPRPSTRGRYVCPHCKEVFRTKRGIGIHSGRVHKEAAKKA